MTQYVKIKLEYTLKTRGRSIVDIYNDLTHIAYTLGANQVMERSGTGSSDMSDLRIIHSSETEVLYGFYAQAPSARNVMTYVHANDRGIIQRFPKYVQDAQSDTIDPPRFDPVTRTVSAEMMFVTNRIFEEDAIRDAMAHYSSAIHAAIGADVTFDIVFNLNAEALRMEHRGW